MSKKAPIPYERLRGGDIAGFAGRGPFSTITRCVTGRKRWRDIFNRDVWTHVGMVVEIRGQLFIAEMKGSGLELNSMEHYRKKIHSFARSAALDNYETREGVQNTVIKMMRYTVDYDYKGLVEFVNERVTDNPRRLYCSELVYELTKKFIQYPDSFAVKVSPEGLHQCHEWVNIGR